MAVYDGLTRNQWPGTWSPSSDHPIVLDTEIRGALRFTSGEVGDKLEDITGQRLQEGMLVYLKTGYDSFAGDTYYKYSLLSGESRNIATGEMPNATGNWSVVTFAGASELSALTDVSSVTPSTGQVLKWDGSEWAPAADSGSGGGIALSDISVVENAASGNGTLSYNNVTGVITYTPPTLFDGDYNSLTNTPTLFDGQYSSLTGTPTLFDGDYNSLTNTPTLFDGDYNSLTNTPTIPTTLTDLSITDGTSGQFLTTDGSGNFTFTSASGGGASELGDLLDVSSTTPSTGQVLKWDGSQWAPASDLSGGGGGGVALTDLSVAKASAGGGGNLSYNNSTGIFLYTPPDLTPFASTSYVDTAVAAVGPHFDGNYNTLTNKPTLFSGDYNDLANTPSNVLDLGIELSGAVLQLVDQDSNNLVIDQVDLSNIAQWINFNNLLNKPTLFSGDYNDLTNAPILFSGSYTDLSNKPVIPSLSGYATEGYVRTYITSSITSDNITEGGTNLYYNNERVDDRINALFVDGNGIQKSYDDAGNLLTLAIDFSEFDTDDIIEGSVNTYLSGKSTSDLAEGTNLYYTDARARNAVSATGSLSYNNVSGVFTYTQGDTDTIAEGLTNLYYTDARARASLSAGTGVTYDNVTGEISIGQDVSTTSDVTFNDVTVSGDLSVLGTLTSINSNNTEITDNIITLNQGEVGAGVSLGSAGIEIDRGSESNVRFAWDETSDQWTTQTQPISTGNITAGEEIQNGISTVNVTVNNRNIVMAGRTTDATPTELFLNDGSSKIDIASGTTAKFKATFVATDGTDTAAFSYTGIVHNQGGTTSLIGINILETIAEDTNNYWSSAVTADDANDYLKISVTGTASTTIDWTVFVDISEVKR